MNLFSGLHEVRVKTPLGMFAGYFDDERAALSAVEQLDYTAAWATLNPIRPDVLTPETAINPSKLQIARYTARDEHIERRTWLLLDFDAERPDTSVSATDAEKALAVRQAEECRAELTAAGWPSPTVIDSGNGLHLRYRVELSNDSAVTGLVRAVLHTLSARYPALDVTCFNAARVAKLPGTWARKGESCVERPHRQSKLLEEGEGMVSEAQMRALAPEHESESFAAPEEIASGEAKAAREWLLKYIDRHELAARTSARRITGGWRIGIHCPLTEEDAQPHDEGVETSTVLQIINGKLSFSCAHNTCQKAGRRTAQFKAEMLRRHGEYEPEPGADAVAVVGGHRKALPPLTHADLAADFLAENKDCALIADVQPPLLAAWAGGQWQIRPDKRLLNKAVSLHLKRLHGVYPAPTEGRDRRGMLKASDTLAGVVNYAWLDLPEVRREQFDSQPYLLGLPSGMVADLKAGEVRPMQRDDYVSRTVFTAPDADCSTPRWTRFLREITCNDDALAEYLRRLLALCLTGHAEQAIFVLYGAGRNGKGSFIRVAEKLLNGMAVMLRPRELAENRFSDDANKRTLSTLEGARLVCVQEAVTSHLDFPLLKTLSGGDSVSAAGMRENARQIRPTWKLFLVSNEQPVFPADAAFRSRVHLVPFRADFSRSPETTIDETLRRELPGILAELIRLAPSVIHEGLRPPASVLLATQDLFAELDVAARFQADWLTEDVDSMEEVTDVQAAAIAWLQRVAGEGVDWDVRRLMGELRKRFGKRYSVRRVNGESARVLLGVKLKADAPAKPSTSGLVAA